MYNIELSVGITPQHLCRPLGYCNDITARMETADDSDKKRLINQLAKIGCDGGNAFRILRKQVDGESIDYDSLIAMGRIRYDATIDIVVGLLRKFREEKT